MIPRFREYLVHDIFIDRGYFLVLLVIYISTSNWYYIFSKFYSSLFSNILIEGLQSQWIRSIFDFSIALSILSLSFLAKKIKPYYLIFGWSITSSIAIILLNFVSDPTIALFAVFFFGIIGGAGALANVIIFFNQTKIMERGRVGGIVVFASTLMGPLFLSLASGISPQMTLFILSVTPLPIILLKPKMFKKGQDVDKRPEKLSRNFTYYFLSWTILCLNNGIFQKTIGLFLSEMFPQSYIVNALLQFFSASFGAIISGILADWFGRKMILLSGFLIYGIANSIVGFTLTPTTQYIAYSSSGLSWGFFLAIFYLAIWGESNQERNVILSYSLALSVFHFATGLGLLIEPYIMKAPIVSVLLLSSPLIFTGMIPLFLAMETVPEDILKKMWFNSYKKWVKDFTKKNGE